MEFELGVNFNSESKTYKIKKAVSSIEGVESVFTNTEIGRLVVVGRVDPEALETRVREFEDIAQILSWKFI